MASKIAIYWPGDYRQLGNEKALPSITEATVQMERALKKVGRQSYRVKGFLTRPDQAISKLGPIHDPIIGMFVHWVYGPHTVDGVTGKDNPLLLASNFSGQWPGLVGLLNTAACLEYVNRPHSRIWTEKADWTKDRAFMARLDEWCHSGRIDYSEDEISYSTALSKKAVKTAKEVASEIRRRHVLIMMLGDTAMGMINGLLGPRFLQPVGFTEHKVDQAWIVDRGLRISNRRLDEALAFVKRKGITFHYGEKDAEDFDENATREQLRDYLVILDLVKEFRADCVGWQYQVGLAPLRPSSDFTEGLLNSVCRPEGNGDTIATATEADQGNLVSMELMKRVLKAKGLHQGVNFHDIRWGAKHDGRFVWVLLNSGSCDAYAFNRNPRSLKGVHSYRQKFEYCPRPSGTFAGLALPGKITWSRTYVRDNSLWLDVGRGEVVDLPERTREKWWRGTTREWPFMPTDMGMTRNTLMAHYMSNHTAVAYGDIFQEMVALGRELGFKVRLLGEGL